jgi:hypothetical protein
LINKKKLFQVSILLVVLMFIFAIYGIQIIGGQLARCNDRTYYIDQVSQRDFSFYYLRMLVLEIMSWNILERTLCIENEC